MVEMTRRRWLGTAIAAGALAIAAKFGLDRFASQPRAARPGTKEGLAAAIAQNVPVTFDSQNGLTAIGGLGLESVVQDGDSLVLTAKGKDFQDKTKETKYIIILTPEDAGTYRQSEDWVTEQDVEHITWDSTVYTKYPDLFLYPTNDPPQSEVNKGETLNRIVGELTVEGGAYTIRKPTRVTLYDGQVNQLASSSETLSYLVVKGVKDASSGAMLVTVWDVASKSQKTLRFFGNRLYSTGNGNLQTAKQIQLARFDIITAEARHVEGYNKSKLPADEQVDAYAIFSFEKQGRADHAALARQGIRL